MVWPQKAWRWVVVVPATVAALAGGLGDVITGSLRFWYLLAPSYPVIAIAVWRGMDAEAARRARAAAAEANRDSDEGASNAAPRRSIVEPGDPTMGDGPLVDRPRRVNVPLALARGAVRLLATVVVTFICMVAIWAAIAAATWGRGYWYVYGPVLALIAWFAWHVWRSGPAGAKEGEPIVR